MSALHASQWSLPSTHSAPSSGCAAGASSMDPITREALTAKAHHASQPQACVAATMVGQLQWTAYLAVQRRARTLCSSVQHIQVLRAGEQQPWRSRGALAPCRDEHRRCDELCPARITELPALPPILLAHSTRRTREQRRRSTTRLSNSSSMRRRRTKYKHTFASSACTHAPAAAYTTASDPRASPEQHRRHAAHKHTKSLHTPSIWLPLQCPCGVFGRTIQQNSADSARPREVHSPMPLRRPPRQPRCFLQARLRRLTGGVLRRRRPLPSVRCRHARLHRHRQQHHHTPPSHPAAHPQELPRSALTSKSSAAWAMRMGVLLVTSSHTSLAAAARFKSALPAAITAG